MNRVQFTETVSSLKLREKKNTEVDRFSVKAVEENSHMHYRGVKPQVLKDHSNSGNYW